MVINNNGSTEIVNNLKDCTDLLNPELAEAILYFHETGDKDKTTMEQDVKALEQELRSYEGTNESYSSCLNEVLEVAEELKKIIEDGLINKNARKWSNPFINKFKE